MEEQKQPTELHILESQQHYSKNKFWKKVKALGKKAGTQVLYSAFVLYYTGIAPTTPASKKAIIFGALGYFILPADLIPDALPIVGFTDDVAALTACVSAVAQSITPEIKEKAQKQVDELF